MFFSKKRDRKTPVPLPKGDSMKHRIKLALALLGCSTGLSANNVTSHTFFSTRPQNQPWTSLTDFLVVSHSHKNGRVLNDFTLEASVFGGKSRNWTALRDFFLFDGLPSLSAAEAIPASATAISNNAQNILSSNFNVDTTNGGQASTFTIKPHESFVGAALSFRGAFRETWWYSVELPVMNVKNSVDLIETYTYGPFPANQAVTGFYGPNGQTFLPVATMTDAFRQLGMQYGKIDATQGKTGIADVTIKVGCDIINHTDLYLSPYGGVVFPTGNKPKGIYVFEPIVGNNHHYGLLGGVTSYAAFAEGKEGKAWIGGSINARYLFANSQHRLLDLKNRPWSRYLSMYQNDAARVAGQVTFGANLMRQELRVKPGFSADADLNFSYVGNCYHVIMGVNTNMASTEQVSLANNWQLGPQVADISGNGAGYVQPSRGIGNVYGPDFSGTSYIQETELDFVGAAHPGYVAHTLYIDIGKQYQATHLYTYNFGGAYEFAHTNAVMNRWTLFANIQLNF